MIRKAPFLSVIVPAYNVQTYLTQCVDSILNQTYEDFELIIVDDGSTDETGVLCDLYVEKDNRVHVIHKKNGGLVSARKAGLSEAKGKYVAYVDGDDWIADNMFQSLCDCAIKEEADIVIADFISVCGNSTSYLTQNMEYGFYSKSDLVQRVYPHMLCDNEYFSFGFQPSLCSKIFKRSLLVQHQSEVDDRIRLGEDAACFYPMILEANQIFYLKECYYYFYRMRDTSISHAIINSYYTNEIFLLVEHLQQKFIRYDSLKEKLICQLYLYSCYMLDNMITPNLTIKQLFFCKNVQKQLGIFVNRQIGHEVVEYCKNVRTSSRMKRILQYAEKRNLYTKLNLFLFACYEKWFSK